MSVETLTVVISTATLLLTFAGVIGWLVNRIDALGKALGARIDTVDDKLTARIDAVDQKLSARIDAVSENVTARIDAADEKLTARIDAVGRELVEVKIGIARLAGPPRRLLPAR